MKIFGHPAKFGGDTDITERTEKIRKVTEGSVIVRGIRVLKSFG